MKPVVIMHPPRADPAAVTALGRFGVTTVYEAAGRGGLLGSRLRPAWPGAWLAGTALTVLCEPDDDLMVHVAVDQARPGDVLVVTTTAPSQVALAGQPVITALAARQAHGLVTTAGVRDVAAITRAAFPVWSESVIAAGARRVAAGSVNVPVSIGDVVVVPGDVLLADDDGVLCVPRLQAAQVAAEARRWAERDHAAQQALAHGQPTLDCYQLRPALDRLAIPHVRATS